MLARLYVKKSKPRKGRPARPKRPNWPRLAEARASLEHDLALKAASGEPAGRGLSHLAFGTGRHAAEPAELEV